MKVLIAEDDRASRFLLRHILQQEYEIHEANDGVEAWTLIQGGLRPDLCILDVMMPRMDGLELLQKIRSVPEYATLKVIICSSVNERFQVAQIASLDIACYIIKPYATAKVREQVHRVLAAASEGAGSSDLRPASRPSVDLDAYVGDLRRLADDTTRHLAETRAALTNGRRGLAGTHLHQVVLAADRYGVANLAAAANKAETALPLEASSILDQLLAELESQNAAIKAMADRLEQKRQT